MNKYPFIYLNHGEFDADYIGKCEELFIWFEREVTVKEQKKIMKDCPEPVNFVCHWGKEFVYFGSDGDTYDWGIAYHYLKKINGTEPDEEDVMDGDCYEEVLPLFQKDLEDWINKVNKIVPVVLFKGPNCNDEGDVWGEWSKENIYKTSMPYLNDYEEKYPGVLKDKEDQKYYRYILEEVSGYENFKKK
jgi:hypothetical protein